MPIVQFPGIGGTGFLGGSSRSGGFLGKSSRSGGFLGRASSSAIGQQQIDELLKREQTLGLLGRIGRGLDTPGRLIRNILGGAGLGHSLKSSLTFSKDLEGDITGRQLLGFGKGKPGTGLDAQDVMGFLAEVGLDPLMFVNSIFGLSAKGLKAKRATDLIQESKALGHVARTAPGAKGVESQALRFLRDELPTPSVGRMDLDEGLAGLGRFGREDILTAEEGIELALNPKMNLEGLAAEAQRKATGLRGDLQRAGMPQLLSKEGRVPQVDQGFRNLFNFGVPFTNIELGSIRGKPIFQALEGLGAGLKEHVPFVDEIVDLFSKRLRTRKDLRIAQGAELKAKNLATQMSALLGRHGPEMMDLIKSQVKDPSKLPFPGDFDKSFSVLAESLGLARPAAENMREALARVISGGERPGGGLTKGLDPQIIRLQNRLADTPGLETQEGRLSQIVPPDPHKPFSFDPALRDPEIDPSRIDLGIPDDFARRGPRQGKEAIDPRRIDEAEGFQGGEIFEQEGILPPRQRELPGSVTDKLDELKRQRALLPPRFLDDETGEVVFGTRTSRPSGREFKFETGDPLSKKAAKRTGFGKLRKIEDEDLTKVLGVGRDSPKAAAIRGVIPGKELEIIENAAGRMKVADETMRAFPDKGIEFARTLAIDRENQVLREIMSGARDASAKKDVKADLLRYMERVLTPEALEFYRLKGEDLQTEFLNNAKANKNIVRAYQTKTGSMIKRTEMLRNEFTHLADKEFRKYHKEFNKLFPGKGWFEFDPMKAFPQRYLSGELSRINADFATGMLKRFAISKGRAGPKAVAIEDAIEKLQLHSFLGGPASGPALEAHLKKLKLKGKYIPVDVINELKRDVNQIATPLAMKTLGRWLDTTLGFQKMNLTLPFPSFHMRNLFTNVTMSIFAAGANPKEYFKNFAKAVKMYWPKAGGRRNPALVALEANGAIQGSFAREVFEDIGKIQGARGLRELVHKKYPKLGPLAKGATSAVEDISRIALYLTKKADGLTDLEAVREVNKYLFDFSGKALTEFERKVPRRVILFYNFTRRILPTLIGQMFENTGRMQLLARGSFQPTIDRQGLPEFLKSTLALPQPFPDEKQKGKKFITGLGSPFEEFSKFDTTAESGVLGQIGAIAQRFITQTRPLIKAPIEIASGKDFFFRRDIAEADKAPSILAPLLDKLPESISEFLEFERVETPSGLERFRANPEILFALRNTPLSRHISEAERFLGSGDKKLGERLGELLSGVRSTRVDPDIQKARAAEEIIKRLLGDKVLEGRAGKFDAFFARGPEGEKSEEVQKLLQALRFIGKQKKEAFANR